jgi:hypothetical protein
MPLHNIVEFAELSDGAGWLTIRFKLKFIVIRVIWSRSGARLMGERRHRREVVGEC